MLNQSNTQKLLMPAKPQLLLMPAKPQLLLMPATNNVEEKGKHLTFAQRCIIEDKNLHGLKKAAIAKDFKKNRSTIYRELNDERNWDYMRLPNKKVKRTYSAKKAQKNYDEAKKQCGAKTKYSKKPKILKEIEKRFFDSGKTSKTRYSVDAIIGQMKLQGIEVFTSKTMYNYIRNNTSKISLFDLPRILGRKRNKKKIDNKNKRILGTSIEQRPEFINNRGQFGHWEGDSIVDGLHNGIFAKTERLSRLFVMRKLQKHNSEEVEKAEVELKSKYFELSATYDNGSEFYKRAGAETVDYKCYFTHPNSPYEKGSTENNNGNARRHWPKGTNISGISDEEIQRVQDHINNMPRKILGYKTSNQVYTEEIAKLNANRVPIEIS